ncbi:MAG TPA: GNAT family N-acetyltransferase [Streptosporangiaceae bacterium]|nr:GNAT family N-acetyltransferase [Streptosporangiaceae bacterium]
MSLKLRTGPVTPVTLSEHATIPIAFTVDRILQVTLADGGIGGISFTETAVAVPYVKDYDAIAGEGPTRWAGRFDTSNWRLIRARQDGNVAGGAVIAWRTPGLHMLDDRDDIAVLWDIRVAPAQRAMGAGSALFRAAESWAGSHGCGWLKIETQNINVAACRFYRKMGCALGAIDRFAYPELPDEVQLLWWKALEAEPSGARAGHERQKSSTSWIS